MHVLHLLDLRDGCGETRLTCALLRKYLNAGSECGWQFVFPSVRVPLCRFLLQYHSGGITGITPACGGRSVRSPLDG
jgi:hypothetical protein